MSEANVGIRTERLWLRPWREEDLAPFAALNADARVREFFPNTLTREQSDADARRYREGCERNGFGFWAAQVLGPGEFAGILGIQTMSFAVSGLPQPAVEIGWRLSARYWGNGLATEGARAVLRYAFDQMKLEQIVAITVPSNVRSRRVMEKIGLTHRPEFDFDHPRVEEGHPLRRHVLYAAQRV